MDVTNVDQMIVTIEKRALNPSEWSIGVSADPLHSTHAHRFAWRYWRAASAADAERVKTHFISLGMRPDPDESPGEDHCYVYIY